MTLLDINPAGFVQEIAKLGGDFTRSYLFSIDIPAAGIYNGDGNRSTLTAFARSFELPSYGLETKIIEFQGVKIEVAEGVKFKSPWTVEFLSDDTYVLRSTFIAWSSLAFDFNRKAAATPRSYKRKAIVNQLDRKGNPVCSYSMMGLFPKNVSGYTISNDSKEFSRFSVDFAFDYFSMQIDPSAFAAYQTQDAGTAISLGIQ
jgi:hypothetical protein